VRPTLIRALLGAALLFAARPAFADATIFAGASMTPSSRPVRGAAVGVGLLVIGVEFEYAYTSADPTVSAPELKMGTGNVLLQTPFEIYGVQPYFTTGLGVYSETLAAHNDFGVGFNTGGGVKIAMFGPIRFRVDYRVIKLGSGALLSPTHRVYAGLNLKF
jgi:hypothetical protein